MEIIIISIAICVTVLLIAFYNYYLIPQKLNKVQLSLSNNNVNVENLKIELSNLQEENKKLNSEIDDNNILKFKKYAELYDKLISKIHHLDLQHLTSEESTRNFDTFLKDYIFVNDDKKNAYENYSHCIIAGMEAYTLSQLMCRKLNEVLTPILKKELPLGDYDKKVCLEALLDISMICYDAITTAFDNRNAIEKQQLNVQILKGENRNNIFEKAEVMTDRTDITPLRIRVIKKSVEAYGIKHSNIIFSGYKLP